MTDSLMMIRLQTWLSPAFPSGAYAYSSGLESAVGAGMVIGTEDLMHWLLSQLYDGPLWNDAVVFAECWRTSDNIAELEELNQLAKSLCFSAERLHETVGQGEAFLKAVDAWGSAPEFGTDCALPAAIGSVCRIQRIDLGLALSAYLHAAISNQIQAALRLMKIGQYQGVELLSNLEKDILKTANRASTSSLEDLGSSTFMLDVLAMQHQELGSRVFRT